jgi:ubiquinone biosynthesis monooxygenase Coq7
MRVNHCGEVCAQALYDGQAITARNPEVLAMLQAAGAEEVDHLVWCEERLTELETHPSLLNPLFYAASWSLGAIAGLLGDRAGLAFVEATEDQVVQHLEQHLRELPEKDVASRAIVSQMRDDEARHGEAALAAGGGLFSPWQKRLMAGFARVMTATTYRI